MFNGRGCYALAKLWNMKSDLNVQSYNFFKKFYEIHTQQRSSHQCKLFALRYPGLLLAPLVPLTQLCCCRSESLGERPGRAAPVPGVRAGDEEWAQPECPHLPLPQWQVRPHPGPVPRVSQGVQQPVQPPDPHAPPGSAAQHPAHISVRCVGIALLYDWEFPSLSVCVAQHKDQLFLLGQKKRGRRPGSASVTSLNKEIFPTSARQQSHYYNAHDNEDLLENRLSSPQDSKNISMLDLSRLQ